MADKHNDNSKTASGGLIANSNNKLPTIKPGSLFRASILTQKAEALRTDKSSVTINDKPKFSISNDIFKSNLGEKSEAEVTNVSNDFVFGQGIMSRTCVSDFASLAESDSKKKSDEIGLGANDSDDIETLRKNAEEVEKRNDVSLQIEETEVVTGEEDEMNVLRMNCKLYQFNSEKKDWIGKGPCIIRLNDCKTNYDAPARLLARSKGGLKVIVNTYVWSEMSIERANDKSIRFNTSTSVDSGTGDGKLFLVVLLNNADADILYDMLYERKEKLKYLQEINKPSENVPRKRHVDDDNAVAESDVKVARKDESSE